MVKAQVLTKTRKSKKPTVKGIPSKKKNQPKKFIKTTSKDRHWRQKKKSGRKQKEKRGVVYLSHIPHGFYEDQIEAYFKQFGNITAVSVPRSKTGEARGYAFIEFLFPEVAEIAAETMNNYLMFNRVIKAKYIPPAEQKPHYFLAAKNQLENHKTAADKAELRVKHQRMIKNRPLSSKVETKVAAKLLRREKLMKHTMEKLGLDYEIQVERGNIESVFEQRKAVLEEKKKRRQALADKKKEQKITETTTSEDDDEISPKSGTDNKTEIETTDNKVKKPKHSKKSKSKQTSSPSKPIPTLIPSSPKNKLIKNVKENKAASSSTQKQNDEHQQTNKLTMKTPIKNKSKLPEKVTSKSLKTKSLNQQNTPQNKEISIVVKTPEKYKNKVAVSKQAKKSENLVMEVDENDDEINFRTPPNVTKKIINSKKASVKKSPKEKKRLSLNVSKVSLSAFKSSFPRKSRHSNSKIE